MLVAVLGSKGPFADAVALYSQHLARPRPPPGNAGRRRRRPQSASAAITSTRAQPLRTTEASAVAPCHGQNKDNTRPRGATPTTGRARPASAAASAGARANPTPSRPSRPRTAIGTRDANTKGSTHHHESSRRGRGGQHLRRRVVSAGGYPSNSYEGDYRKSSASTGPSVGCAEYGSTWEYGKECRDRRAGNQLDMTRGNAAATGSHFYHEHHVGIDSEVMQRATEFISKIAKARKTEEGQNIGGRQTSHCESAQPDQVPEASTTQNCLPGGGTAELNGVTKRNNARPVRRRRRRRTDTLSTVPVTATKATSGGETSVPPIPIFAASAAENILGAQTSSGRQQQQQQRKRHETEAPIRGSATVPFPPSGGDQTPHDGFPVNGVNEGASDASHAPLVGSPRNIGEDGLARALGSDSHNAKPKEKGASHSVVTPLAFDVFCSLRPTFFKDTRPPRERPDPTTSPGGAGLPNSARNGDVRGNHQSDRKSLNERRNFEASTTLAVGDFRDRRVASTWTSVFGAVCEGAERGRARAEVLKAARREALGRKRSRKRAASAAAIGHCEPARDAPAHGKILTPPSAGDPNGGEVNTIGGSKNPPAATTPPETSAEKNITDGSNAGETLFPESRGHAVEPLLWPASAGRFTEMEQQPNGRRARPFHGADALHIEGREESPRDGYHGTRADQPLQHSESAVAPTSPLFRHPYGGGTTRIGVNAPRSLQVCPGDRGFSGVAIMTSRHSSSPHRWRSGGGQFVPSSRSSRRRPATASGGACSILLPSDAEADGASQTDGRGFPGEMERSARPETAWSFFSRGASEAKRGARWPIGSEKSNRWTDGDSLRRRVDDIADAIAEDLVSRESTQLHDGTRFQGGSISRQQQNGKKNDQDIEEAISNEHDHDTMAGILSDETVTESSTEQRHQQIASGVSIGVADGKGLLQTRPGDATSTPYVQIDARPAASGAENRKPVEVGEAGVPDVAVRATPAPNAAVGYPNSNCNCDGSSAAPIGWRRARPRPASAPGRASGNVPNSSFCVRIIRRSDSSHGRIQGSQHSGQSLAAIVDIAEPCKYPGGRHSRLLSGEAKVLAAASVLGLAEESADLDATLVKKVYRRACGDGANDTTCEARDGSRGGEGQANGDFTSTFKLAAEHRQIGELVRDAPADTAFEDGAVTRTHNRSSCGDTEPGASKALGAGCVSKTQLSTKTASVAFSTKVETPLEFRKAVVKLKVLAAEAGVAVDGHEEAWRNSKEHAEQTFNELRFAAEEDAQRAGSGAAMETRRRLQRIVKESGLENSRRVEKEAALEEIRRVLRQDTGMYEARASASDNMLQRMRTVEADNDSCDLSILLECRQSKSLLLLRDRTERERDELRAACRRRRREAAVMDDMLAEARHARGLLLGHTHHTVERMACLAEYVTVMRRWLRDKLSSRRHARVTSKAIKLEFERKSQELDSILRKEASAPSALSAAITATGPWKSASPHWQTHTPHPSPIHPLHPTPTRPRTTSHGNADRRRGETSKNCSKGTGGTTIIDNNPVIPARSTSVGSPSNPADSNHSSVVPPANLDLSVSLDALCDASSQLRRLLIALRTQTGLSCTEKR